MLITLAALLSCGSAAPVRANAVAMKHTRREHAKAAKQRKLVPRNSRSKSDGVPFRRFCRDNAIFKSVPIKALSAWGLCIGGHPMTPWSIPDISRIITG